MHFWERGTKPNLTLNAPPPSCCKYIRARQEIMVSLSGASATGDHGITIYWGSARESWYRYLGGSARGSWYHLSWGRRHGIMVSLSRGLRQGIMVSLILGAPSGDHGITYLGGSVRGSWYPLSWGLSLGIMVSRRSVNVRTEKNYWKKLLKNFTSILTYLCGPPFQIFN